ncbi:xanthine phosphoribosyltransferase [Mediannikoviicoccus vaginalis]|uniref:xanthine phosphoribosyltransferase n=1 Tax=Mediannikoviicoccus vaginalis TaxID=2899727 RepID=UPI001F0280D0|nr:xanthine phosphoribosyltransferase [Mediannikoviicoccus vaginalis]
MNILEKRILDEGIVLPGNVLKVDGFVNHRIDPEFFMQIAEEFKRRFEHLDIDKILTVEVSGIAIAFAVGLAMNKKVVFAKKNISKTLGDDVYKSSVYSYTKGVTYDIMVSKNYLNKGDRVLVIDDFLANGKALEGVYDILNQAGAELVSTGILIEKGFQNGGKRLREKRYEIESLATIKSLENGKVEFENSVDF